MSTPIEHLREIVARLRSPGGCPWDIEQTPDSLIPGMIEEVYEVIEAIEKRDHVNLREELGDLLLQVVMQAQIASEEGRFHFDDLTAAVSEKLIRRHPHVFGNTEAKDSAEVLRQWDEIKRAEKGENAPQSLLDGVPKSYPALLRAKKLQIKAAKIGFDWPDAEPILDKIYEELGEVRSALFSGDAAHLEEEIGDLFFSIVNLSRKCGSDPELTLQKASDKFLNRFQQMESLAATAGADLKSMSSDEMEMLWGQAKALHTM